MRDLIETLQQISLGLFVNGSYALMQNGIDITNIYIAIGSTACMFLFNRIKRRYE